MIIVLIGLIFVLYIVYSYAVCLRNCRELDRCGIRYKKPLPLIGNFAYLLLGKKHLFQLLIDTYNAFPNDRYVAIFESSTPAILLRDPDLINDITVKHFNHFQNHRLVLDPTTNLLGYSLMSLKGQHWKKMRAILSPFFKSNQLRIMTDSMVDSANNMINSFKKLSNEGAGEIFEVNAENIYLPFSNDVIMSTVYGIETNTFKDLDNNFYRMGLKAPITSLSLILYSIMPKIMEFFKIPISSREASDFYNNLALKAFQEREVSADIQYNLMDILRQVKEEYKSEELTAHALEFYIASGESTASTTTTLLHILATKPHIQKKLREEIDATVMRNGNHNITYDMITEMQYMDMVLCEALRLWTTGGGTTGRFCNKKFNLPPPRSGMTAKYTLQEGSGIYISGASLHYDSKYWDNPEEVIPERFSEKNKRNIKPGTYIPFGLGPRNCIGSRFAMITMKIWIYTLLANFEIVRVSRTSNTLKVNPWSFTLKIVGGIWVGLKTRTLKNQS